MCTHKVRVVIVVDAVLCELCCFNKLRRAGVRVWWWMRQLAVPSRAARYLVGGASIIQVYHPHNMRASILYLYLTTAIQVKLITQFIIIIIIVCSSICYCFNLNLIDHPKCDVICPFRYCFSLMKITIFHVLRSYYFRIWRLLNIVMRYYSLLNCNVLRANTVNEVPSTVDGVGIQTT